ncbi:hypothetical protein [Mucilaginibacter sp. UYCu711]|uniref:hypothetical protein n=1 Tax=Mucilaginibacter sp. UYCu711 TaxID=3156339 RepID=UPI003D1DE9A1
MECAEVPAFGVAECGPAVAAEEDAGGAGFEGELGDPADVGQDGAGFAKGEQFPSGGDQQEGVL